MNALHAEEAVLGCMLLDPIAVQDATAVLSEGDFSLDSHQRLYGAIRRLERSGVAIDYLTVFADLKARRELDSVGGTGYILELTEKVPRGMNIQSYVRMVRDASMARRALRLIQAASAALVEGETSAAEVVDALSRDLASERPMESRHVSEVMADVMADLDTPTGLVISTGVPSLDKILDGGWRTGELGIIAAFPSGGKSALVRQTERAALPNIPTHTFSVEVTSVRWVKHHAGRQAGIRAWETRELHKMGVVSRDKFVGAGNEMTAWPYFIDDMAGMTVDTLIARARLSAMRYGTKLVTVDFLQLLVKNHANMVAEITAIVWKLKAFAKEYGVAVVALSQLTEDRGTGKSDGKPRLNQMAGAGAIRQAADVAIMCHRPLYDDSAEDDRSGTHTGMDELLIAKQREGITGPVPVQFNVETLQFEERSGY